MIEIPSGCMEMDTVMCFEQLIKRQLSALVEEYMFLDKMDSYIENNAPECFIECAVWYYMADYCMVLVYAIAYKCVELYCMCEV